MFLSLVRSISNLSTLLLFALLVTTTTQASPPRRFVAAPVDNGPGTQLTRKLENRYLLYENQFIRLLPLSRSYLAERAVLHQLATSDDDRRAQLRQLDTTYETSYRALLTPWQIDRLHKAHSELAPKESFAYFLATQLA
jgi:hypothetical protein